MDTLCAVMVNTTIGDPLARLAALTTRPEGISCSLSDFIESMSDTEWDNTTTIGAGGVLPPLLYMCVCQQ